MNDRRKAWTNPPERTILISGNAPEDSSNLRIVTMNGGSLSKEWRSRKNGSRSPSSIDRRKRGHACRHFEGSQIYEWGTDLMQRPREGFPCVLTNPTGRKDSNIRSGTTRRVPDDEAVATVTRGPDNWKTGIRIHLSMSRRICEDANSHEGHRRSFEGGREARRRPEGLTAVGERRLRRIGVRVNTKNGFCVTLRYVKGSNERRKDRTV